LFLVRPREDGDGAYFIEKAPGILAENFGRRGSGRTGGHLEAYALIKPAAGHKSGPFALMQWSEALETTVLSNVTKKHQQLFRRPRTDADPEVPLKPMVVSIETNQASAVHVATYRRRLGQDFELVVAPQAPELLLRGWVNASEVLSVAAHNLLQHRPECIALLAVPIGQDGRSLKRLKGLTPAGDLALADEAQEFAAGQDEVTEELKQGRGETSAALQETTCADDDDPQGFLVRALGGKGALDKMRAALVADGSSSAVLGYFYELLSEASRSLRTSDPSIPTHVHPHDPSCLALSLAERPTPSTHR